MIPRAENDPNFPQMLVLDVAPNNATVTIRWDIIDSTFAETRKSPCWVTVDAPRAGAGSLDNALDYSFTGLYIAFLVPLSFIFVVVVLLGAAVIVMFKRMKQLTGFYSYSNPDTKKPLIQK